jgi:hypothetical protein
MALQRLKEAAEKSQMRALQHNANFNLSPFFTPPRTTVPAYGHTDAGKLEQLTED